MQKLAFLFGEDTLVYPWPMKLQKLHGSYLLNTKIFGVPAHYILISMMSSTIIDWQHVLSDNQGSSVLNYEKNIDVTLKQNSVDLRALLVGFEAIASGLLC